MPSERNTATTAFYIHIIVTNIATHLGSSKTLNQLQDGFRKRLLCDTQLLSLFQDLASRPAEKDLIVMDFSKAFEKVPHRRLLYKLEWYGLRGGSLDWIRSFLADMVLNPPPPRDLSYLEFHRVQY